MATGDSASNRRLWSTRLRLAVCVAISAAALIWLFSGVQIAELKAAFGRLSLWWIAPLVGAYLSSFVFRAWRWKLTLAPVAPVSWRVSAEAVVLGYAANNVLPGRLGEIVRAVVISTKSRVGKSAALVSVVVERVFDAATLLLILGVTSISLPPSANNDVVLHRLGYATVLMSGVAIFGILIARVFPRKVLVIVSTLLVWAPRGLREKLLAIVESGLQALRFIDFSLRFAATLVLGIVVWGIEGSVFWLALHAMGISDSPLVAGFALAVVNFGILVPAAPGYVGVFQAAGVYALGIWGIAEAEALASMILIHAVQYFPVTILGFLLLPASGLSIRRVETEAHSESGAEVGHPDILQPELQESPE